MSDKPMTQNELDDIRRRLEVVTPGPLAFEKEDGKVLLDYTPKEIRICETGCLGSIANRMVCDMNVDWRYTYKNENEPMANAEFIAHAPTDIARLMAEVERLRGEVARLDKEADWLVKILSNYTEDCPLKFKVVYELRLPIPKIDQCSEQEDDIEDCAYIPSQCWREAARKAVEDENG